MKQMDVLTINITRVMIEIIDLSQNSCPFLKLITLSCFERRDHGMLDRKVEKVIERKPLAETLLSLPIAG
jgi:hypothetical protein